MINKVLIKLIVPELNTTFDVLLPVNEVIWKIKKMMVKSISDLMRLPYDLKGEYLLLNKETCSFYPNNETVLESDIRNGTELLLLSAVSRKELNQVKSDVL